MGHLQGVGYLNFLNDNRLFEAKPCVTNLNLLLSLFFRQQHISETEQTKSEAGAVATAFLMKIKFSAFGYKQMFEY